MSGELERLLIKIEADTMQLRREMAQGDKAVAGFAAGTERHLARVEKRMDGFAAQIGRSLKRYAALFGTTQLAFNAFDAVGAASDVADLARHAALSGEAFQVLAFAAQKAGMGVEGLSKSSLKFALNIAELRANYGALDGFLKEHLPNLRANLLATTNQEQAYKVMADAMLTLRSEEDKTALALKAFGKSGADMVEILQDGSAGLQQWEKDAKSAGAVLDDDVTASLERAADGFRRFKETVSKTFSDAVGNAFIWFEKISKETVDRQVAMATAEGRVKVTVSRPPEPKNKAAEYKDLFGFGEKLGASGAQFKPYEKELTKTVERDDTGRDALNGLMQQRLQAQAREREAIYAGMDEELRRFKDLLAEKKISAEQFEQARQDITAITAAKISESIKAENAAYRENFREIEGLITSTFMGTFSEMLQTGKFKAGEFFASLATGFAELTMQALILKPIMDSLFSAGGLGSSLFGSLGFGGARAMGGPVTGGTPYLVGERGPELFTPNTSGRITPNNALGGGGPSQTNIYNIDARGADIGVLERIQNALAASEARKKEPVEAVGSYQRRFPNRGF